MGGDIRLKSGSGQSSPVCFQTACMYGAEECLWGDLWVVLCWYSSVETVYGGDGMLNWAVSVPLCARLEIHAEIGWECTLASLTVCSRSVCKMVTCSAFISVCLHVLGAFSAGLILGEEGNENVILGSAAFWGSSYGKHHPLSGDA